MKRLKTLNNFTPKYKNNTIIDRKFNEFYKEKIGTKTDLNKTVAEIKKSEIKDKFENEEKPNKLLTASERKLKQFYPDLSLAEIEKIKKNSASLIKEIPEKKCIFIF